MQINPYDMAKASADIFIKADSEAAEGTAVYVPVSDPADSILKAYEAVVQNADGIEAVGTESLDAQYIRELIQTGLDYEAHGAACLSVLTDREFFMGANETFEAVRKRVQIPMLRKDFLIDPYQVYESRAMGADAVLVIMRALGDEKAAELTACAATLGMDVLVETHDEEEIERALKLPGTPMIGINNRNLRTFETSIEQTLKLKRLIPQDRLFVTESGIRTQEDVQRLRHAGVGAFLVGEAFMREISPGAALQELFGDS